MKGKIHSIQSLGTVDGPGIRFVVFLQGCPLRCGYCHNPDTWNPEDFSLELEPKEILERILRYKSYFSKGGGLTVSGGEALLQAEFVFELFSRCKEVGIHTCLDTSGCLWNRATEQLLSVTDLCLLDIKMTTEEDYKRHTGGSLETTLTFLEELEKKSIPTWIRHVVVKDLNNTQKDKERLEAIIRKYRCVKKIEYLPFRKLCLEKYRELGLPFPFENYQEEAEVAFSEGTNEKLSI